MKIPKPARLGRSKLVTILMATYQGADFVAAQLESIAQQTHKDWQLLVSDDGSTDDTRQIVADFAMGRPAGQVRLVDGPRQGPARNFLHLLILAPDGMLAFSDQDDVWFHDKLTRAVAELSAVDYPAHYAARTIVADTDLINVTGSRHFRRPLGFQNALVQSVMAGNTSVFNAAAATVLRDCAPAAIRARIKAHDWWAYQITAGIGAKLIHDPKPALLYRQHLFNELGRNDTIGAMILRLSRLFAGDYRQWLSANLVALHAVRDRLLPQNRDILDRFTDALGKPGPHSALKMQQLGLYRQTHAGTAALLGAGGLGRLRCMVSMRAAGKEKNEAHYPHHIANGRESPLIGSKGQGR